MTKQLAKHKQTLLITILHCLALSSKLVAGTWTQLDTMPTGQQAVWSAAQSKLCADAQGKVYWAFQDYEDNYKIRVMKLQGNAWQYVGTAAVSEGQADNICIAADEQGAVYVAYTDQGLNGTIVVKKYSNMGWTSLGIEASAYTAVQSLSLVVSPEGQVSLAFINQANANRATILQYNNISWEAVGESSVPTSPLTQLCLSMSKNGTLVIAFNDEQVNNKLSLMTFSNKTWTVLGARGVSTGTAQYTSIASDTKNRLYLAFRDNANNAKPAIYCYDKATWNNITGSGTMASDAANISLSIMNDSIPVLAYSSSAGTHKTSIVRYQNAQWQTVGADGFMPLTVTGNSLATTATGLYAAFEHIDKSSVWKYTGLQVKINSTSPDCIDNATGQASAIASNGVPPYSYAWSNGQNNQAGISNLLAGIYRVTATDQLGEQCSAEIKIDAIDTSKPQITCPATQTITIADSSNTYIYKGATLQATATDNCFVKLSNSLTQTASLDAYQFAIGKHAVIWTATDNSGNTASCSLSLVVSKQPKGMLIGGTVHGDEGIAQLLSMSDTTILDQAITTNQNFTLRAPSSGEYVIRIIPNNTALYSVTYYGNTSIREQAIPIQLGTRNIGGLDIDLQPRLTNIPLRKTDCISLETNCENQLLIIHNPQAFPFCYRTYSMDGRILSQSTMCNQTRLEIYCPLPPLHQLIIIETEGEILRFVW